MSEANNVNPTGLYNTALGEKNRAYYVRKFQKFDHEGLRLKVSWNWPAFFFGGIWALYRKMYGWFFGWWFVVTVLTVFKTIPNAAIQLTLAAVAVTCWLGFAVFANSFYHSKIKARIANANKAYSDAAVVDSRLGAKASIHPWVPMVFGAIPVIGIVAAVAIPAYLGKAREQVASIQLEATANVPTQATAKPELQAGIQPKVIGTDTAIQELVKEGDKKALAELEQAQLVKAWQSEVSTLIEKAAAEGLNYQDTKLRKEFDGLIRAFATEASQRGMSDEGLEASKWALQRAHETMKKRYVKPSTIAEKKKPTTGAISSFDELDAAGIGRGYKERTAPTPTQTPTPVNTVADAKKLYPGLVGLDDDQVVDALHEAFYQDLPREQVAKALGVTLKPTFVQKMLGPIDRWRYESCQKEAALAPTSQGVGVGLRICREKFSQ